MKGEKKGQSKSVTIKDFKGNGEQLKTTLHKIEEEENAVQEAQSEWKKAVDAIEKERKDQQMMEQQQVNGQESISPAVKQRTKKKKLTTNTEFEMKFKRLGFSSGEQNPQLTESFSQKGKVDIYVDELQPKLDGALGDMRNFLDRRYQLLVNQLTKVREKLVLYYEELKNLEDKIEKDKLIKMMTVQLANYKEFSFDLKQDIDALKKAIKSEEEQALSLFQVYTNRKHLLDSKNKNNLMYSQLIVQLQSTLASYHKQDVNNSINHPNFSYNQDTIHEDASTAVYQQSSFVQQQGGSILQDKSLQQQLYHQQIKSSSKLPIQEVIAKDPLSKIEAYCGTFKQAKSSQIVKKNQAVLDQGYNEEISLISQNQALSILNSKSFISNKYLSKSNTSPEFATRNNQRYQIEEDEDTKQLREINRHIEKQKAANSQVKNKIVGFYNKFLDLYELYQEGLNLERKSLEKSQKKVLKEGGLQGSLLFEMKKAELFLTNVELKQKMQNVKNKTNLQDREMRFVVHDTLSQMVDNKQQKHKKEYQKDDFMLEWQAFKDISPAQIIGLMSLKPQVFEESKTEFEKKARSIKDKMKKNKILQSIS